jgi:hypothetical protein
MLPADHYGSAGSPDPPHPGAHRSSELRRGAAFDHNAGRNDTP